MRIRWFGQPWGRGNKRAPICEDDEYRIDVPIGTACLKCLSKIRANDRGVVTAASPEIHDSWQLTTQTGDAPPITYPVVSYHAQCFFDNILGTSIGFVLHEDEFEVEQEEKEPESIEPGRGWGKEQT